MNELLLLLRALRTICVAFICATAEAAPANGSFFSVAVIPDTQYYAYRADTFAEQIHSVCNAAEELGVALVTHVGDIVQDGNRYAKHWAQAAYAMAQLDAPQCAHVARAIAAGNHDDDVDEVAASRRAWREKQTDMHEEDRYENDPKLQHAMLARYDEAFDLAYYREVAKRPGAHVKAVHSQSKDEYARNFYQLIDLPSAPPTTGGDNSSSSSNNGTAPEQWNRLISITLQYMYWDNSATEDSLMWRVMRWADTVLTTHADRKAFLTTHNCAHSCPGRPPGGIVAWLIQRHCNVLALFCGHNFACGGERAMRVRDACGISVPLLLADYQNRTNGGDGWMRYYEFDARRSMVHAHTYSPALNEHERDANSQFSMRLMEPHVNATIYDRPYEDWWSDVNYTASAPFIGVPITSAPSPSSGSRPHREKAIHPSYTRPPALLLQLYSVTVVFAAASIFLVMRVNTEV